MKLFSLVKTVIRFVFYYMNELYNHYGLEEKEQVELFFEII